MSTLTMGGFEAKLRKFARNGMKKSVKRSLAVAANELLGEMRRRFLAVLHRRSQPGLYGMLKLASVKDRGNRITAYVGPTRWGVGMLSIHESGATVKRGGSTWTIPARPVVGPAVGAKLDRITKEILRGLMVEYGRTR